MMYQHLNQQLKEKWKARKTSQDEGLIYDGIIHYPSWEKAPVKILVVLKEAYGGGEWDIAETIAKDGGILKVGGTASQATQYRLAEWIYALNQGFRKLPLDLESEQKNHAYPEARKMMIGAAYMNLKKLGGVNVSSTADLQNHIHKHRDLLQEQLNLINPDVILCCGTFDLMKSTFFSGIQKIDGLQNTYAWNDKTIFATYHPAARNIKQIPVELWEKAKETPSSI